MTTSSVDDVPAFRDLLSMSPDSPETEREVTGGVTDAPPVEAIEQWMAEAVSGADADSAAHRLLVAAAQRHCTPRQQGVLALFLQGKNTSEIARELGVSQSTVHRHLYGDARIGDVSGEAAPRIPMRGVVQVLRDAMKNEAATVRALLNQQEQAVQEQPTPKETAIAWYSGLMPSRYHLFGPLAVLLVAHLIADAKRSVSVADLQLYVPKPMVSAALPQLRACGYVATDGIAITIRKTPLDEMKERL